MRSELASSEIEFTVNGVRFAAQAWGNPQSFPVLALHGWLDNSASFYRLAQCLYELNSNNFYLVALDFAGHGRSESRLGQTAYNLWDDISDVIAIADHFAWQTFGLLGHSRGAIVSFLTAGAFPERVRCLGLIEGMLPEPAKPEDAPKQLASAIKGLHVQLRKSPSLYPDVNAAIKARENGMFPLPYAAAKALTERGVKTYPDSTQVSWSTDPRLLAPSMIKLPRDYLDAFVKNVSAPINLLLADQGLPQSYPNYFKEVEHYQINYELLKGGHHMHMDEQVDTIAEKLNSFFMRML
jgi:pimeloyl-ACP methyl ester carboxylesterase